MHFSYRKMEQGVEKAASVKIVLLFVAFIDFYTTWCITCLDVRFSQAHNHVDISHICMACAIQRWEVNVIALKCCRWFGSLLYLSVWPQQPTKPLTTLLTQAWYGVQNAKIGGSLNAFSENAPCATSVSVSRYPRIPALSWACTWIDNALGNEGCQ